MAAPITTDVRIAIASRRRAFRRRRDGRAHARDRLEPHAARCSAAWPQSLRTAVSIMLESRFAMVVAWGPSSGSSTTTATGRSSAPSTRRRSALPRAEIFPEVWHVIGPEFERVRRGESFAIDDWLLPLERNGYLENCWFTLSYSPIRDEIGRCRRPARRRRRDHRSRAKASGGWPRCASSRVARPTRRRPREVCERAAACLRANPIDVPFALIYLLDAGGERARLVALRPA